jgi:hypothetical protein
MTCYVMSSYRLDGGTLDRVELTRNFAVKRRVSSCQRERGRAKRLPGLLGRHICDERLSDGVLIDVKLVVECWYEGEFSVLLILLQAAYKKGKCRS